MRQNYGDGTVVRLPSGPDVIDPGRKRALNLCRRVQHDQLLNDQFVIRAIQTVVAAIRPRVPAGIP